MAQYEPIGIKSGIATTLGTDTLRADLSGLAGLTTAAPAAGDACQVSGALTIAPAVNTSANPIVGIYDGVTGSVVRRGVVVASFVGGLTLVAGDAVYLSNVAGRLTNVKPTTDNLHEVGVVVSAAASTIMLQIKPVVVLAATMMMFDARSSWLLQGDAPPAYPGEQQAFPSTAAATLAALGSPVGWTATDVYGAYLCDSATPLVDSLGFGPALNSNGVNALNQREGVGLPTTSFNAKLVAELIAAGGAFNEAVASAYSTVPAGEQRSLLALVRMNSAVASGGYLFVMSGGVNVWGLQYYVDSVSGDYWVIRTYTPGVATVGTVGAGLVSGIWTWVAVTLDGVGKSVNVLGAGGDGFGGAYGPNDLIDAAPIFCVGTNWGGNSRFQIAGFWWFKKILTHAMCASFWRAFNLNEFNTPVAYTRAGPLVAPITASRVAAYGTDQPAVGFNANFVAGTGNAAKVGTVCEDGITFEAIGSDNCSANTTPQAGGVVLAVDGPSGMRDGMRYTMGGVWAVANAGYQPNAGCAIVGASNVPWRLDVDYRRGLVNTTARTALYYSGSGAGVETFLIISSAASPVDFVRGGGTCTPMNADQTAVYVLYGASLAGDDCDFGEPALVKSRSTAPLAWRRVGLAAAASTATPVTSITNVGNARYSPAKGRLTIRFAGMLAAVTGGECLISCGPTGNPGCLWITRATGTLTMLICDDAGAVVINFNTAAIAVNVEHTIIVQWDAAAGTASIMEGGAVLGSQAVAPWIPEPTDVTPIYVGVGTAGLTAARCLVALENISNY